MYAHHPVRGLVDNQFHEGLLIAAADGVFHGLEGGLEQADMAEFRPRLVLGETHAADVGLAEHRGGNEIVVHGIFGAAKLATGEGHALGQGHRREFHAPGDVAQGEDARFAGAKFLVHDDGAEFANGDLDVRQSQALQVGLAPGGVQYRVGFQGTAIAELQLQAARGGAD